AAGMRMFERGGNAVDAGVAAGLALTVLKPQDNGIGGEVPILVYDPRARRVVAISGMGTAPARATIAWFRAAGIALTPGHGFLPPCAPAPAAAPPCRPPATSSIAGLSPASPPRRRCWITPAQHTAG